MADKQIPEVVNYNLMGAKPVGGIFNIDPETLLKEIKRIANAEINDVLDATYQFDKETGRVGWFLWFPKNSDHFQDKSTQNSSLKASIPRYSEKFKNFVMKYGWCEADDDPEKGDTKIALKNVVDRSTKDSQNSWISLRISINPFLYAIFDLDGNGFHKEFNQTASQTRISRKYNWRKASGDKFANLVGLTITKTYTNAFRDYTKPKANWNGKF